MKKIHYFGIGLSLLSLSIGALVLATVNKKAKLSPAESEVHTITLKAADTPSTLTDSYQDNVTGTIRNSVGYEIPLNFVNAKAEEGKFVNLAPRGMIYNFHTGDKAITGINGIKFKGTGVLFARTARAGQAGGAVLHDFSADSLLTSDVKKDLITSDYFQLVAGDGGAVIEQLDIYYSCDSLEYDIRNLEGKYTGKGNDASTYEIVVGSEVTVQDETKYVDVSIRSLDKDNEHQINLSGKAEMLSASQVKCTFDYLGAKVYYVMNVDAFKHSMTFVSKSDNAGGTIAPYVAEINVARVYKVEDFELETSTGAGYTSKRGANSKYSMSGLQGNWFSDYYGSNTVASPVGGEGWSLMGTDNYLIYKSNLGHNGSKVGVFKGNGNQLRDMSMNLFYGVPQVVGVGKTLSFWARGPWKDDNCNSNAEGNATIKAYAFYSTGLNSSTQGNREADDFEIEVGSDWTRYTLALNPSKYYYGVGFYCKTAKQTYTAIDDIEIYTDNPYAEYVAPVAVSGVELDKSSAEIDVGKTVTLTPTISPENATNQNVTWETSNENIATVNNGVVTGVAEGTATITVKTVDGNFTDTCTVTVNEAQVYLSGLFMGSATANATGSEGNYPISIASGTHGEIEFNFCGVATGVESYECNGSTFTLVTKNTVPVTVKVNDSDVTVQVYAGTIAGEISGNSLVNVTVTGLKVNGNSVSVTNSGSITMANKYVDATSIYNNCDGTKTELQAVFARRWMGSSWTLDDPARIDASTTTYMDGTGAMYFRGYAAGKTALALKNDFPEATNAYNNVSFWIYNPADTTLENVKLFIYKGTGYTSNSGIGDYSVPAHSWKFISCGFNASIYNLQIYTEGVPTEQGLYFDNFCLYHN